MIQSYMNGYQISLMCALVVKQENGTFGLFSPLREPTDLQNYFTEREISRRFTPGVALEPLSTSARQVYCHFSPATHIAASAASCFSM